MTTRLIRDKPRSLADVQAQRRGRRRGRRWPWLLLVLLGVAATAPFLLSSENLNSGETRQPSDTGVAAAADDKPDCPDPVAPLQSELTRLSRDFNGKAGIAVVKVGCRWVVGDRLDEFFPQQSVSKLWVSLAVLDAVDHGTMRLDDELVIGPHDLTLFHQPLRTAVLAAGAVRMPVLSLMNQALTRSDNTANDKLLWTVGGPDKVRDVLRRKGIKGVRFGPGERLLQSHTAGLEWLPSYSLGRNFEQARARLPLDRRHDALTRYLADPIDGAKPAGMARALAKLADGKLLSPQSTALMMNILSTTHSGPRRLKAGAPEGWTVYHKTGTGQDLRPLSTGYNDVGLLMAPDGTTYALAVMIAHTAEPNPVRMELMQAVTRTVAQFHDGILPGQPGGASDVAALRGASEPAGPTAGQ